MDSKYQKISDSFREQVKKVLNIAEFDKDILSQAIQSLEEINALIDANEFNESYKSTYALSLLNSLVTHGPQRHKYTPVYNQSIVLLVSYFDSTINDVFRHAVSKLFTEGAELSKAVTNTELKFTLKELAYRRLDISGDFGDLLLSRLKISFQDMKSIQDAFEDFFGVESEPVSSLSSIIVAQACRNSIVHNGEIVDAKCVNQLRVVKSRPLKPELQVDAPIEFNNEEVQHVSMSMQSYLDNLISRISAIETSRNEV